MKAILEFNLPEENEQHRVAVQGYDWMMLCREVDEGLRRKIKYGGYSEEVVKQLEEIKDLLWEGIRERNISFE